MIDATLPWFGLAGFIAYIVVVYRVVRRFTTRSIPGGFDRKALLYAISFGGTILMLLVFLALEAVTSETAARVVATLGSAGLLSSFFAVITAR
jgi:hypothetical protein